MIVHFEISVAKFFGSVSQPVYVADKRSALQDQVRLVGLQDVFAQAWIVQQPTAETGIEIASFIAVV